MKFIIVLSVCLIGAVIAQDQLDGGWSPISTDSLIVKQLAVKAVEHHNNVNNSTFYKKLVKIEKAKQQVVAGMNYEINFLIGKTDCPKTSSYNDDCQIIANSPSELCSYVFWYPIGSDDAQVTSFNCASV